MKITVNWKNDKLRLQQVVDCNSTLVQPAFRKTGKLDKLSGLNQAQGFSLEFYGFVRSFMS